MSQVLKWRVEAGEHPRVFQAEVLRHDPGSGEYRVLSHEDGSDWTVKSAMVGTGEPVEGDTVLVLRDGESGWITGITMLSLSKG